MSHFTYRSAKRSSSKFSSAIIATVELVRSQVSSTDSYTLSGSYGRSSLRDSTTEITKDEYDRCISQAVIDVVIVMLIKCYDGGGGYAAESEPFI
jgi:hypothetical protein